MNVCRLSFLREAYRWRPGTVISKGDWAFGEGYGHDILGDLNRGAVGWLDCGSIIRGLIWACVTLSLSSLYIYISLSLSMCECVHRYK